MPIRMMPVAHPDHPLHALGRELSLRDLRKHRHLVVRDTSSRRDSRTGTVEVAQRWTVSNMATSIDAACKGHGFAWLPVDKIRDELAAGILKPLSLRGGNLRELQLYLIFGSEDSPGPGVTRLVEIIRQQMRLGCGTSALL
jgi:DNA-binding transcriptional LysR family regulator